jgi:hypothetical protein
MTPIRGALVDFSSSVDIAAPPHVVRDVSGAMPLDER